MSPSRSVRVATCAAYAGFVIYLSLAPPSALPATLPRFHAADKVAHFGIYAVFALLTAWTLSGIRLQPRQVYSVLAGVAAFGLAMELLQHLLTGGTRAFEWGDVLANTAGVITGWIGAGAHLRSSAARRPCVGGSQR